MKHLLGPFVIVLIIISFNTQSLTGQSPKKYKVWITKIDSSKTSKGYISEVGDSTLTVMKSTHSSPQIVHVDAINKVKFRKKEAIGIGLLRGAIIGFTIGAMAGFASGDDNGGFISFSAEYKAFIIGTTLAIPGAIIGALIGTTMKVKIPINGDRDVYSKQKERLKSYEVIF